MHTRDYSKLGWNCRLDYKFPNPRKQKLLASWSQAWALLPLTLRYLCYWIKKWFTGQKPVMDFIRLEQSHSFSGVPLGGIGGGTIGRSFKGDFYNYQMIPGQYDPIIAEAMHFILTVQDTTRKQTLYQTVLTGDRAINRKCLSSWKWNLSLKDIEYTALYPRSWTEYLIKELDLTLICRQISPVIPHNYKDSSVPGGVFEWIIENNSDKSLFISITFTMNSAKKTSNSDYVSSEMFSRKDGNVIISGVMLTEENEDGIYSLAMAALHNNKVNVTKCPYFNADGNGAEIWDTLRHSGELKDVSSRGIVRGRLGSAVCCGLEVLHNGGRELVQFNLAWDMPIVRFPKSKQNMKRYYTKYFNDSGKIVPELCLYCLGNYGRWEQCIEDWQSCILESDLPAWYKSAIFNELYYMTAGTVWFRLDETRTRDLPQHDPRIRYGRFGYLEGLEYRMYNTYDVHFYASFALIMLWPKLQLSLQYDMRDAISVEDQSRVWYLYNGFTGFRKTKDTVPHDFGDPDEAPFELINSYPIHDVSNWRDLNLKFVLQVYRDYVIMEDDIQYLRDMFNNMTIVMKKSLEWDIDDDGMIENSGCPDQTYDAWIMTGTSAYCGGLWLAALAVYLKVTKILNELSLFEEFSVILEKAKVAFERKLWTGNYFKFDSSTSEHSKSIMADQLCGLWYLHCCQIKDEVFSQVKVKQALSTIYKYNVSSHYGGTEGAVNGMLPDFKVDKSSTQSEEVWTGVTYALSALLYYEGMKLEAMTTAAGIYKTVYEASGLGFATPEALTGKDRFRAIGYLRPLSIWSLQLAIENSTILTQTNKN
ncbi:non-lysosomal glucosylceramidase isoform X2 [Rhodnius prolixus]|uniref:non-lysosomal glucosylceramidase isoform X2 n=1 Tax=Rhodnius prolixus TaxID=13249 RepID=UPI003D18925F